MKSRKPLYMLFIILGLIGLGTTGYLIVIEYVKAKSVTELLKPVILGFIPFFLCFVLTRAGINGLIKTNK